MLEIKENQELNVANILSFKGKVRQVELENIGKEMETYIQKLNVRRIGNPITATYSVEGDMIDVEILMQLDGIVPSSERFAFKKMIRIVNAVVASYKGHPIGLQEACNSLNQYMIEHKLQPITVGYNVTKKTDMLNPENTEIDVYVGISPNIL